MTEKKTNAERILELLAHGSLTHGEIAEKMGAKSLPAVYPAIAKLLEEKKIKRRELKESDNRKKDRRVGSWLYEKV